MRLLPTRYASTPVWRALVDLITKTLPGSFSKVGKYHPSTPPSPLPKQRAHPACTVYAYLHMLTLTLTLTLTL